MTDYFADRVRLNVALEVRKDDQEQIGGSTSGTTGGPDSATYKDISGATSKNVSMSTPQDWNDIKY